MKQRKPRISRIYALHYVKLAVRSLLFVLVLLAYILGKIETLDDFYAVPVAVWVFFVVEMLLRFFPSRFESMGCQKQFERNYVPKETTDTRTSYQPWYVTLSVALVWLALNGVIGALYLTGVIDRGIMVLVCLFFSVCDIICILFFCPFQTWFMKNRCCTTCRIYNWDFAMMFTPLVFVPSLYTYSLLGCALILLLRWEIGYRLHRERFSPATNACLDCASCEEKLCSHKKQLRGFLKKYKKRFFGQSSKDESSHQK